MAAVVQNNERRSSRQPPLTQTDAITSLLSLSLAAAGAAPASGVDESAPKGLSTTSIVPTIVPPTGGKHHRRLSSQGKTRRRLSDAREATARPLLVPTGSSSGSLSLATLSLSTSPPSGHNHSQSLGQTAYVHPPVAIKPRPSGQGIPIISASAPNGVPIYPRGEDDSAVADDMDDELNDQKGSAPISVGGKTKKRGVDYVCESCSKIYRHPNCLNKHRWEHTRQWREASKFVLSKHQQVQLLEAAAILSYMGTSSTSLPEDRSEWPSFLSGGSLPKVDPVTGAHTTTGANPASLNDRNPHMAASAPYGGPLGHGHYASSTNVPRTTTTYALHPHPVSSSVPNVSPGAAGGPRLHDYSLPASGAAAKVTQVRPGLLGVPTAAASANGAVPHGHSIIGGTSAPAATGGWSLPNSSMRAGPDSLSSSRGRSESRSRSRSGSGSRSDESLEIDIDVEGDDDNGKGIAIAKSTHGSYNGYPGYPSLAPGGLSHSPGYGYGTSGSYGASGYGFGGHSFGRRGMGMKREEDEMSVGFSVREEDEDEEEEEEPRAAAYPAKAQIDNKWNGMEMEMEMDMD